MDAPLSPALNATFRFQATGPVLSAHGVPASQASMYLSPTPNPPHSPAPQAPGNLYPTSSLTLTTLNSSQWNHILLALSNQLLHSLLSTTHPLCEGSELSSTPKADCPGFFPELTRAVAGIELSSFPRLTRSLLF